ncbi:MAG: hypothetical protein ACI4NM_01135 [Bullifex sp.]
MSDREKKRVTAWALLALMFIASGLFLFVLPENMSLFRNTSLPSVIGVWILPVLSLIYTVIRMRTEELGSAALILLSVVLILICITYALQSI